MPNARYTISFPSKDSKLINFVEEKKKWIGLSAYLRELIRKDMDNQENPDLEEIFVYVLKRITEEGHLFKEQGEKKINNFIDEVDKDIIMDLF